MALQSLHIELLARDNGQSLYEHTREVLEYATQLYGDGPLKEDVAIAAILHDLGKAQNKYQALYRGKDVGQREHAVASAWIGRALATVRKEISCIAARLAESHHKGLHQSEDASAKIRAVSDAVDALENIINQSQDPINELLKSAGICIADIRTAKKRLNAIRLLAKHDPTKVEQVLNKLEQANGRGNDIALFVEVRKALGALVVGDSLSAAGLTPSALETRRKDVPSANIQKFLIEKRKHRHIDKVRESIGLKIEDIARKVDLNQRIFTIALPTGAGKTLHSLRFATILRERIQRELHRDPPRILYVMPFTTIIDQAYDVFSKIYGDLVDKRHYLTDEKQTDEAPEEVQDILRFLYPAEITVTTYVQLYSALTGNGRRDAIRALGLRGRIIILDEVQAIPYAHWQAMKTLLHTLSRENWIILMSATVPKYVVPEHAQRIVDAEDIPDREVFNRHIFKRAWFSTYDKVVEEAVNKYLEGKSVAIVVNTVSTAEEMYFTAKQLLEEHGISLQISEFGARYENGGVVYLSTYVPPFARKGRIELFDKHVFAITTQVIEAGVDVSVSTLYRELAPVDAIVQAAGRCNRNGESSAGEVIVFETDDTERKFKTVYGQVLWTATTSALPDTQFTDMDIGEILNKYYESLKMSRKDDQMITDLKKSVENCSFTANIAIIQSIPRIPVVVMYPEAKRIVDLLREEYKGGHNADRKKISGLFRKLGRYIVNVYPKQAERFDPLEIGQNTMYRVDPTDEDNYAKDVGILYNPRNRPDAFEDRLA